MSSASAYTKDVVYDELTGRDPVATRWLAVFSAVTDEDNALGTEIGDRVEITFGAHVDGTGSNDVGVIMGPLAGSGTATHSAVFDASTGGNARVAATPLAAPRPWSAGDSIEFAAGDVAVAVA